MGLMDTTIQLIAVVLTNISFVPVIALSWKRRNYVHAIIFFMVLVTSLAYHFAETMDKRYKLLGTSLHPFSIPRSNTDRNDAW